MITLSTTAFNAFSTCPKKYQYAHVDRIVPKPHSVKGVMRRGSWIHAALEEYHRGGQWQLELSRRGEWLQQQGIDEDSIAALHQEVDLIMRGYIDYWILHGTTHKTLAVEKRLDHTTKSGDLLSATIDQIFEDRDGIWIREHKSTSEIPPASWRAIDPQTMIQFIVARANGFNVTGIEFNYLWTKVPSRPRIKKNGEFYADAEKGVTTSLVWDEMIGEHTRVAQAAGWSAEQIAAYQQEWRQKLVNDGAFYQRFRVDRPVANARETVRDIQSVLRGIHEAEASDYYRRAFHVTSCRRFCSYANLCSLEYVSGRRADEVRATEFVQDSDEIRYEGRR